MNKQEPIKFKMLGDEEIQGWCDAYYIEYYLPYAKELCQAQLKDTLNQVKSIVCDKCRDIIDEWEVNNDIE